MSKAVIARIKNRGEWGFESAEKALKLYPDAKIVSYADGTPYEAPSSGRNAPSAAKKKASKTVTPEPEETPAAPSATDSAPAPGSTK